MADIKIRNFISDYLTCPICQDIFTDPKLLQCGHSYCSRCLESHLRSLKVPCNTFECPVCRNPHTIEVNTEQVAFIRSLSNDLVSLSLLNALDVQPGLLENECSSARAGKNTQDVETKPDFHKNVSSYCTCARHEQKQLNVDFSQHEIVVCSESAVHNHSDPECEFFDVGVVTNRRLSALKCMFAQQTVDASRLFQCTNPAVKTINTIHDDFQNTISELEVSFMELCELFCERIKSIRRKAQDIVDKDITSLEVKRLQELLMTKIKSFEDNTADLDPNDNLKVIYELCRTSSRLQKSIHHLTEKIQNGSLMKYAESDLILLDAYVSAARQTLPETVKTFEEMNDCDRPDDKGCAVITAREQLADSVDNVNEEVNILQHFSFNAKCADDTHCNLSSVAILGTTAVVVVDQNNKKLKKFKLPEGRFLTALKLEMEPHQAATLRESSDVAVTLWDTPRVLIVSTDPTIQVLKTIDTSVEYIGIVSNMIDSVAVSSIHTPRVDVLHIRNYVPPVALETIYQSPRRRSFPDRLAATADGRIIVHSCRGNEVCCFGRQRALMWSRKLKSSIADIVCLRGKVFATIRDKGDIVYFNDSGQGEIKTLKPLKPVNKPWAIDGFKNCFVVSEDAPSSYVHVIVFA